MRILAIAILAGSMLSAAEVVHLRDEGADAFFPKPEGCFVTTYQVSVNASTLRIPSQPSPQQSTAGLAISRFDVCTGTQLMFAFGTAPISAAEFQIAQDLSTASLHVSIALLDQLSGQSILTTLSLTWTATDSVSQGTNSFHTSAPGIRVNSRSHGRSRMALASGQIVENGVTVLLDQSVFAQIRQSSSGTVVISK